MELGALSAWYTRIMGTRRTVAAAAAGRGDAVNQRRGPAHVRAGLRLWVYAEEPMSALYVVSVIAGDPV